jgi:hypothetical protein
LLLRRNALYQNALPFQSVFKEVRVAVVDAIARSKLLGKGFDVGERKRKNVYLCVYICMYKGMFV